MDQRPLRTAKFPHSDPGGEEEEATAVRFIQTPPLSRSL